MKLGKFSLGMGDRFGHQGKAQLQAVIEAQKLGLKVVPVWNKSNREHTTIGSKPGALRVEADAAVAALGWEGEYHVDADHIGLKTVDLFMEASDFFTLDVADSIGKRTDAKATEEFVKRNEKFIGDLKIPGIDGPLAITREKIEQIGANFLLAAQTAGAIWRKIEAAKGAGNCIIEVSMDETDHPQTPVELLFILEAIAHEGIPAQTIAPKFTGRFNKGVDYVGDVRKFEQEFEEDVAVIAYAVKKFGLPDNLKLSVHSGSDKFSIYEPIRRVLGKTGAGLHIKTAGTTWLEELIGLAIAGGEGLAVAKAVYREALDHIEELCAPYATVIDIDRAKLPGAAEVDGWSGEQFARTLRHDPSCPHYNPSVRQLLHVGYKVAAKMGDCFTGALEKYEATIAENVTHNILDRHLKRVFPASRESVGKAVSLAR